MKLTSDVSMCQTIPIIEFIAESTLKLINDTENKTFANATFEMEDVT